MALVGDVLRRAIGIGSKAGNLGAAKSIIRFGSAASTIPDSVGSIPQSHAASPSGWPQARCRARHGG